MTGLLGAALAVVATATPLSLDSQIPWYVGVLAVLLLGMAGGASVRREALRTVTAVLLVGWVATALALGEGPVDVVAITSGLALRGWAGVPELMRLGRPAVPDLVAEVVGGAAVAGLLVVASRRTDPLPPEALIPALLVTAAVVVATVVRLRR